MPVDFEPVTSKEFIAPTLPEPSFIMFLPWRFFKMRNAKGMEPIT